MSSHFSRKPSAGNSISPFQTLPLPARLCSKSETASKSLLSLYPALIRSHAFNLCGYGRCGVAYAGVPTGAGLPFTDAPPPVGTNAPLQPLAVLSLGTAAGRGESHSSNRRGHVWGLFRRKGCRGRSGSLCRRSCGPAGRRRTRKQGDLSVILSPVRACVGGRRCGGPRLWHHPPKRAQNCGCLGMQLHRLRSRQNRCTPWAV